MNLKEKAIKGVLWTGLSKFSVQGLQLVVMLILARLLMPDDFGVIGIATIVTAAIAMVNERGLTAALIQRENIEERHLSSWFWASLAFGVLLFILCASVSGWIAVFFEKPIVRDVVILMSVGFIIGAFGIIQKALLNRELNFKKLAVIEIWGVVTSGIFSISLAFSGFGVWSLVWGSLINHFTVVVLLWIGSTWKPKWLFDLRSFRELLGFSANVMGTNIALYANSNVDYLIVGKFLGTTPLGFYTLAFNLVTYPVYKLSAIVTKVAFPAFSAVQDNLSKFRFGYLKSLEYISSVTFPILSGLMLLAPEFIHLLLGEKWSPIITPLRILCPMGLLKSVGTTKGSVILARGRADIELKWNVIFLIPLSVALIFGSRFGLVGVATAYIVVYILGFPIIQGITNSLIDLKLKDYLQALYPAVVSTGAMVIFIAGLRNLGYGVLKLNELSVLISSVILGMVVYLYVLSRVNKGVFGEILGVFSKRGKVYKPSISQ